MKKIFLIGDSIRFGIGSEACRGYGYYVKEKLDGVAEVYAPDTNCRFAQHTQRYVYEWATKLPVSPDEIDVVHWNNGLWDVLRIFGEEPFTSLEFYVEALRRVYVRIRKTFPNARIVFATTTSVIEEMSNPDFTRRNSDIEAYNAAAAALMKELGVEVNDLHKVSLPLGRDFHHDWVHFNNDGSKILADAVIKAIM